VDGGRQTSYRMRKAQSPDRRNVMYAQLAPNSNFTLQ
jgi:hypothetical protein